MLQLLGITAAGGVFLVILIHVLLGFAYRSNVAQLRETGRDVLAHLGYAAPRLDPETLHAYIEEVSAEYLRAFDQQAEIVEGPVADRWGNWVSALVPLKDGRTIRRRLMHGNGFSEEDMQWLTA